MFLSRVMTIYNRYLSQLFLFNFLLKALHFIRSELLLDQEQAAHYTILDILAAESNSILSLITFKCSQPLNTCG